MEYGVAIYYVEWQSDDGMEEEASYVGMEIFADKKEMKAHQKRHANDENYRYEYCKIKWLNS